MNDKNYPYLGIFSFPHNLDESYVVLFSKKSTGVIVSTTMKDNEQFRIGNYSENWNESMFSYLDPSITIKLNND